MDASHRRNLGRGLEGHVERQWSEPRDLKPQKPQKLWDADRQSTADVPEPPKDQGVCQPWITLSSGPACSRLLALMRGSSSLVTRSSQGQAAKGVGLGFWESEESRRVSLPQDWTPAGDGAQRTHTGPP